MKSMLDARVSRRRALFWLSLSPALASVRSEDIQAAPPAPTLDLPLKEGSLRFAVMGDTGRGDRGQIEMAKEIEIIHAMYPFDLVLMVGDNIYGSDSPADMQRKFERPYEALLQRGVKFQAALGNHDNPNQRFYKPFNMGDRRYYTFRPPKSSGVRFFVLDTNYVDKEQTDWLEKELASSTSDWKIAYFHHPLYSSGATHGSALETRATLEPLFVKYGVSAVFAGHDHFYERIKPQKGGIVHWVCGAGGSLRKGDIRKTNLTAKGFDTDYHFMIAEISGDDLFFQAISRGGQTIDSGVVKKVAWVPPPAAPLATPPSAPAPAPDASPR
jgi:hypothetical protein